MRRRASRLFIRPLTLADEMRRNGAVAHWDPFYAAVDVGISASWTDRIGGHVLSSVSASSRLAFSAALAGLNGLPGWTGSDPSSTRLISSNSTLADMLEGSNTFTVYAVRKCSTVTSPWTLLSWGSSSVASFCSMGTTTTNGAATVSRRSGGVTNTRTSTQSLGTALSIDTAKYDGTAVSSRSNGVSGGSTNSDRVPTTDRFCLGALYSAGANSQNFTGNIGDVVVFAAAHSTSQMAEIERRLAAKYGVAL